MKKGLWLFILAAVRADYNFTKVIVPSVYHEWRQGMPDWATNETFKKEYGYDTFLYQKNNSALPNYIATNRGNENGVYFAYIVDHYDNFPDIAIFTHGKPHEHSERWLNLVKCVSPKASYFSINTHSICRESWNAMWAKDGIWLEQCIRDTLRIVWGNLTVPELNAKVSPKKSIKMCTIAAQQFLISREVVHKRSLKVWKELQYILSVQNVCHVGEPDYENLFAYQATSRMKLGPEDPTLGMEQRSGKYTSKAPGRITQGVTSEHLAHVIFGHHSLVLEDTTMKTYCSHYLSDDVCPGSPCSRNYIDPDTLPDF
mmetsp:Transcript_34978/g.33255  ORF Transcript_34978/g.33255 Transcript_34978/m.33255 type:complete len:314 (+) Transcript_34978:98-1039(+)